MYSAIYLVYRVVERSFIFEYKMDCFQSNKFLILKSIVILVEYWRDGRYFHKISKKIVSKRFIFFSAKSISKYFIIDQYKNNSNNCHKCYFLFLFFRAHRVRNPQQLRKRCWHIRERYRGWPCCRTEPCLHSHPVKTIKLWKYILLDT